MGAGERRSEKGRGREVEVEVDVCVWDDVEEEERGGKVRGTLLDKVPVV